MAQRAAMMARPRSQVTGGSPMQASADNITSSRPMIVTTTENIPGTRVVKTIGQVFGLTVRSRSLGGDVAYDDGAVATDGGGAAAAQADHAGASGPAEGLAVVIAYDDGPVATDGGGEAVIAAAQADRARAGGPAKGLVEVAALIGVNATGANDDRAIAADAGSVVVETVRVARHPV